jgi:hypothetical protein
VQSVMRLLRQAAALEAQGKQALQPPPTAKQA